MSENAARKLHIFTPLLVGAQHTDVGIFYSFYPYTKNLPVIVTVHIKKESSFFLNALCLKICDSVLNRQLLKIKMGKTIFFNAAGKNPLQKTVRKK
jgi:hypothetical protein